MAVGETLRAAELAGDLAEGRYEAGEKPGGQRGDRRVGVVWHTQGSGKSLTMAFYAGRIVRDPAMENPTLVVLTDRNDLDDQLFGTFSRCHDLLRQTPVQAESRADLREAAARRVRRRGLHHDSEVLPRGEGRPAPAALGPAEHRRDRRRGAPQPVRLHRRLRAGTCATRCRNASFIGFTGTPIELQDANTRAVFGDYISVYDIQRAVEDGATVPIYYESRLAKLALDEAERPKIDAEFEEATEGEEVERKEKLKTKWAQLEAVVGAEKRLALIAEDIVEHFEARLEALDGKAMIVCMSRRICVELYHAIVRLRPDWQHDGRRHRAPIKVVMTGSASDPLDWQPHIRNKPRREALAKRFKDAADPLKLVIVRDMWLTGFDAPCLHTMYVDKPMRGHGLMQAIARVNRVFKDKPGGLVVDYLGLAHELKAALATYTESGGTGRTALDQSEAVAVMLEKYEVCCGLFHGFDWSKWARGYASGAPRPAARGAGAHPRAGERKGPADRGGAGTVAGVCAGRSARRGPAHPRRRRLLPGGAGSARQAGAGRGAGPRKSSTTPSGRSSPAPWRPRRWWTSSPRPGLAKPDISILSDEFLAEVRGMPQRNLAVELLRKLLERRAPHARAEEHRPGAVLRRRCWSSPSRATRTAPSRPRR